MQKGEKFPMVSGIVRGEKQREILEAVAVSNSKETGLLGLLGDCYLSGWLSTCSLILSIVHE
jgi:hypothetical protein